MKKIIIILVISIILGYAGITYLNNVFLPKKVQGLIIGVIEEQTQNKVTLGSLRVNIFKGLVLKDLIIYDKDEEILSAKEASCVFLVWGLLRKKIIIPSINLKFCRLFLERRKDNTFNLADLFPPKQEEVLKGLSSKQPPQGVSVKAKPPSGFSIEVYRINILNSTVSFKDNSFDQPFNQDLENVNMNIYLSLPSTVKFKASLKISGNPKANIALAGEFNPSKKELSTNISMQDILLKQFSVYFLGLGINIKDGLAGALISLRLKDDILGLDCQVKALALHVLKDKISLKLDSKIEAHLKYGLKEARLSYFGRAFLTDSSVLGLDFAESINGINAEVNFNNDGLNSDNILANIWDIPVKAKLKLNDFNNPVFNINAASSFDLVKLQSLLKNKFRFAFPGIINGDANLSLNIAIDLPAKENFKLDGYLDIVNAAAKLDKINDPIRDINGRVEFTPRGLKALGVSLRYQGIPYKLSVKVDNFQSPDVALKLASEGLMIKSNFTVDKAKVNISGLSGRYLNSDFNAKGNFDTLSSRAELSGTLGINLEDLNKFLPKFKEQLGKIRPRGNVQVQFNFEGDVKDIKSYAIEAQALSPQVSLWGFKGESLTCNYNQRDGIMDIPLLNFSFYKGLVNASAKANLNSDNFPFSLDLAIQDIKIEELKLDTSSKDKDISGIIQGEVKINGLSNNLSKLIGAGNISITKGKLWELDLFQGLGKLLFAENFANISFHEGSCSFVIQDNYISTSDLMLKSNMVNLSGPVKIGFNNSINASLNVDILSELVPLNGTVKDITTAIIGESGKFATINITGTLKDPKYKFKPVMENIIKGLTDTLKNMIFKK